MDAPSLHGRWRLARLVSHDGLAERAAAPTRATDFGLVLRYVHSRTVVSASEERAASGPARTTPSGTLGSVNGRTLCKQSGPYAYAKAIGLVSGLDPCHHLELHHVRDEDPPPSAYR